MSAVHIIILAGIAVVATLFWALVTDAWAPRQLTGMFLFGFLLLLLPGLLGA